MSSSTSWAELSRSLACMLIILSICDTIAFSMAALGLLKFEYRSQRICVLVEADGIKTTEYHRFVSGILYTVEQGNKRDDGVSLGCFPNQVCNKDGDGSSGTPRLKVSVLTSRSTCQTTLEFC